MLRESLSFRKPQTGRWMEPISKERDKILQFSEIRHLSRVKWQLLMRFAEYRIELPIKEVVIFPNGHAYHVCPRCDTPEREIMAYCDRCGRHLGWRGYKKAKVVSHGNRKKVHI